MAFGFYFDMTRCIGCRACQVACKDKNRLEVGTLYRNVKSYTVGTFPNVKSYSYSGSCNHCENPICLANCPTGAISKAEDGTVVQDQNKCIGCRMCVAACPYTGVRSFNWAEPEYTIDFECGGQNVPAHQKHTVEKCTMCWHRLAKDEEPMCIRMCPERARFWGDLDDPNSEISKVIREREYMQLLPEKGTKPSVYYLV